MSYEHMAEGVTITPRDPSGPLRSYVEIDMEALGPLVEDALEALDKVRRVLRIVAGSEVYPPPTPDLGDKPKPTCCYRHAIELGYNNGGFCAGALPK